MKTSEKVTFVGGGIGLMGFLSIYLATLSLFAPIAQTMILIAGWCITIGIIVFVLGFITDVVEINASARTSVEPGVGASQKRLSGNHS